MKQGWLVKMGNNVIKDWKNRWVLMKTDRIEYFRDRLDTEPAGTIPLMSVHVKYSNARPHAMEVVTPTRSYWFVAEDDASREDWMHSIINNSQALMDEILSGQRDQPQVFVPTKAKYQSGASVPLAEGVQYQGYLQKQGRKGLKPYRQRWAVIRGDTLFYYNSESVGGLPLPL